MRNRIIAAAAGLAVAVLGIAGTAHAGRDLDAVRARGMLNCGVGIGTAGFMLADSQGKWKGLSVDVCRAVAATIFGDAEKVRYVPLTSQQRFTALQSSEVDMVMGNATYTLTRDTALGLDFTGVYYYDGQGFLVPKKLGVKSAKELGGATVCVAPGTTTELNLADYFRANKMTFKPVVIEKVDEIRAAFFSGRCDVYTTDASSLAATRAALASTVKRAQQRQHFGRQIGGARRGGIDPDRVGEIQCAVLRLTAPPGALKDVGDHFDRAAGERERVGKGDGARLQVQQVAQQRGDGVLRHLVQCDCAQRQRPAAGVRSLRRLDGQHAAIRAADQRGDGQLWGGHR